MNILEEVQIYVADRLNADSQLSGLCPFIFENKKDIDYEIKSALGKQGVVGLVMTPKATFAGAYEDKSLAWQIDELEIDIIENVTVNRGKKNGYVTGQDAAMRLFEVMCPLSGEGEGQFNAVSYEEGEDNSLLVNKCILKCLVHSVPLQDTTTKVKYAWSQSWDSFPLSGTLNHDDLPSRDGIRYVRIGSSIDEIGYRAFRGIEFLTGVEIPDTVTTIGTEAFAGAEGMPDIEIPSSVSSIGSNAFFGCHSLSSVTFLGKTIEQVQSMENYPWGIDDTSIIHVM